MQKVGDWEKRFLGRGAFGLVNVYKNTVSRHHETCFLCAEKRLRNVLLELDLIERRLQLSWLNKI